MKKLLFLLISIFILYPSNVFADMGPKPSVKISVNGIQETAYMTLLSKEKSTGPWSVYDVQSEDNERYFEEYGPKEVWQAFVDYKDKDDFYFLQYFQLCEGSFQWTYYPPDEFKVLIYFPESKTFIMSSDSYKRYAFDSFFTVTLTYDSQNMNVTSNQPQETKMVVKENYIWNEAMLNLAIRMLITIIIEVIVGVMMHIKSKKEILIIIGTNIFTQIILNLLLEAFQVYSLFIYGAFFYILFEVLVIFIEMNIYKRTFTQKASIKSYTITANILSFLIGFMV